MRLLERPLRRIVAGVLMFCGRDFRRLRVRIYGELGDEIIGGGGESRREAAHHVRGGFGRSSVALVRCY